MGEFRSFLSDRPAIRGPSRFNPKEMMRC